MHFITRMQGLDSTFSSLEKLKRLWYAYSRGIEIFSQEAPKQDRKYEVFFMNDAFTVIDLLQRLFVLFDLVLSVIQNFTGLSGDA
jgi:hypothetical protein